MSILCIISGENSIFYCTASNPAANALSHSVNSLLERRTSKHAIGDSPMPRQFRVVGGDDLTLEFDRPIDGTSGRFGSSQDSSGRERSGATGPRPRPPKRQLDTPSSPIWVPAPPSSVDHPWSM